MNRKFLLALLIGMTFICMSIPVMGANYKPFTGASHSLKYKWVWFNDLYSEQLSISNDQDEAIEIVASVAVYNGNVLMDSKIWNGKQIKSKKSSTLKTDFKTPVTIGQYQYRIIDNSGNNTWYERGKN